MAKSTISMAMFNSYVSLPKAKPSQNSESCVSSTGPGEKSQEQKPGGSAAAKKWMTGEHIFQAFWFIVGFLPLECPDI